MTGRLAGLVRRIGTVASALRRLARSLPSGVHIAPGARVADSVVYDMRLGGTIFIGSDAQIEHGVILAPFGGRIQIEARVYVGPYSILYGHGGLSIGEDSLVAAQSVLIPANHIWQSADRTIASQGERRRGISIGRDVWLGAGVRVLDGISIGEGAVVGAGAVVTNSLPAYSQAVGVPARVVGKRNPGSSPQSSAV